jgi:lysophospholipase L1-like esterase
VQVSAVVVAVLAVLAAPPVLRHAFGHPAPVDEGHSPPIVVVLGDSFVEGSPMNRRQTWPDIAGLHHGWTVYLEGLSGTGYVATGFSGTPFPVRAARLVHDYSPDVVVVAGGLEDVLAGVPEQRTLAAADTTLRTLRDGLPRGTRIVVLSPFARGGRPTAAVTHLADALRPVAEADGATYIDVTTYLEVPRPGLVGPDHTHPTDDGHRMLALKIADALIARRVLPR